MKKFNAGWIVLIVFCSIIVIGGVFYLLYRLYINHIYKRKRYWYEITSPLKNKLEKRIDDKVIFLIPRQSISPLIQEFLPKELKQQRPVRRKMVTQLQFDEPPVFVKNLKAEWDEMDMKSIFSSQLMSTRTSYYTIDGHIACEESISDEQSLVKYFSITSSNEFITSPSSLEQFSSESSSQKHSPLQSLFNPFVNLSKRLLNDEDKNNSSNYIVLEMEPYKIINISNNVSQL